MSLINNMAFSFYAYDYNADTKKETFVKWITYKVKPVNRSTCWYISCDIKQEW